LRDDTSNTKHKFDAARHWLAVARTVADLEGHALPSLGAHAARERADMEK